MKSQNSNKHLTLDERRVIRKGIENGSTCTAIAQTLGKDNSTISKEIKKHRVLKHHCNLPLECSNYRHCKHGRECTTECIDFIPFKCTRRDRYPGACNGCGNFSKCRFNKYYYEPEKAQSEYEEVLVDSREGVNLTTSEAKEIAVVIEPLLKQGQSPCTIVSNHPELGICEKTLYNYIESGVFSNINGIEKMSLRRALSRKIPKSSGNKFKKRDDRSFLKGRTYADYLEYMSLNPDDSVVQMDTVYNDETKGPFIQTFKILKLSVFIAFLHKTKTALGTAAGVEALEKLLGKELFEKYVRVILTDRGTEFSNPNAIETRSDGTTRTRVFYCNPMCSNQKGSLENKHIELRYICPKGTDLYALGLTSQDKLNLALSHLNSSPCEKLFGKSPLQLTEFLAPDVYERLQLFGIHQIPADEVILKPYLLK